MGEMTKPFNRTPQWLGKTIAAAVLAWAILPGSALAMATYDVAAFADLFFDELPVGVTSTAAPPPTITAGTSETGNAQAQAVVNASTVVLTDDEAIHNARVFGQANATGADPSSSSFASLSTSSAITLENASLEVQSVDIFLAYSANLVTTLDDILNEAVSASVEIFLDAFDFATGANTPLFSFERFIDSVDEILVQDAFETTVSVAGSDGEFPGEVGLTLRVNVLGSAESVRIEPPVPGVPVPATLALLGIGLLGLASHRRRAAA